MRSGESVAPSEPEPRRRTAWVSGASGGLGGAFVAMLRADGFEVWGTAREVDRLETWSGDRRFHAVRLDLADPAGAEAAFTEAQRAAGGAFDVCIQNAGAGEFIGFANADPAAWERNVGVLLLTTARLSRLALHGFHARRPERGTLVHVSSLAAEFPLPLMSSYNVGKAGLSALSESLMFECRGTGVTVIDFRPGDYRTAFNKTMHVSATLDHDWQRRLWQGLEHNLEHAPEPERAARDLGVALRRGRSGVVRSGAFFQARLAPLLARLVPQRLLRASLAWYFGGR